MMSSPLDTLPIYGGNIATTVAASTAFLLLLIGLATRLLTGWIADSQARSASEASDSSAIPTTTPKLPPLIPYWIPFLGHIPNFIFRHGKFLPGLRDGLPDGVASLNLLGTTHVFIFRHSIGSSLLSKPSSAADAGWFRHRLLNKGFGYPAAELEEYAAMAAPFNDLYTRNLLSGPGLARMVSETAKRIVVNIGRFVTLAADPSDKNTPWERMASVRAATSTLATGGDTDAPAGKAYRDGFYDDSPAVEASLEDLVRAFVGYTANPSLLGEDFMDNFPHFWELLWEFNQSWILLVLGLPSWLPSFLSPKAAFARAAAVQAEMLRCVRELEVALDRRAAGGDPGPRWRRLDSVSDLLLARVRLYRARGVSMDARTSNELALIWGMNINSNMLVFWMVVRVAADPALLAGVREEVAPFLGHAGVQDTCGAASVGSIDVDGLCAHCPLLKAAYVESLRIDNSSWDFRRARQDLVLTERREGDGATVARWLIPKGAYAHVVEEMHHTDPRVFPDPFTWNAHRHITVEESAAKEKTRVAKLGLVRPYGGGSFTCPGRTFALRETMAFAAAILHQYDIRPVKTKPDGSWTMPVAEPSSVGIKTLKEPFRVLIKRRKV